MSPGYPNQYPSHQNCHRIVRFQEGSSVQIEFFGEFRIGSSSTCSSQYVEIRDGDNQDSPSIMKVCGSKKPQVTYSEGRSVSIKFVSSYGSYHKGFSLKVTEVSLPECKSS